ncbi:hypothetical protein M758_7G041700 [Ceratodon purpureus]|nr:hypothetical protein M758_7G041700 [Ceratodon purpureus]
MASACSQKTRLGHAIFDMTISAAPQSPQIHNLHNHQNHQNHRNNLQTQIHQSVLEAADLRCILSTGNYLRGPGGVLVCARSGRARSCVTLVRASMAESGTAGSRVEEKLGVRIERGPSEARLQELGIRSWPKWGCQASKFPWTYDGKETCYLLKGKVKVYPEGSSDFVEFGAGDLVVFPKGMSCTWEVSEAVDKHYEFEY